MTEPDRQTSRDEDLENIVDDLQDNVAEEREAQGVPGNAREREETPPTGSPDEPTG